MTQGLPEAFLRLPIAHRAYHDMASGRPENAPSSIAAAIEAGYAIEIDLQVSKDGEALVFHDYDLDRLTRASGAIADLTADEACALHLTGGQPEDHIPTLAQVLDQVAGQVPVLIELKDQSGTVGIGPLEAATARALQGYSGPVAVMSFNPDSMADMARLAPDVPRGLTTCAFDKEPVPEAAKPGLRAIADAGRVGASFISHHHLDLDRPRVAELRDQGMTIFCWTIRSPEEEANARRIVHNVTFEGYPAALAG